MQTLWGADLGLFSGLFGAKKAENALETLRPAFDKIRRVIEDEHYQLEMLPQPINAEDPAGNCWRITHRGWTA